MALLALLAACAPARPAPVADAEAQVVAAEHAFAAAAREGIRDAFLRFADDSAVAFGAEAANAKAVWRSRPRTSARLAWRPAFARAAASGDLGFTTGPYESADSTGTVLGYGTYVTVWRRTADGWRFATDLGTPHPRPGTAQAWTPRPRGSAPAITPANAVDAGRSLLAADSAFSVAATSQGLAAALEMHGDAEMRLLRPRSLPRVGLSASVAAAAADSARRYSAHPRRAQASVAGDLGWVWGEYRYAQQGSGRRETGHYVRIWTRAGDGPWRLLLDAVAPRPPERDE